MSGQSYKFFVYALTDQRGNIVYIGKGSGRRLKNQIRSKGFDGHELCRFKSEKLAYDYEKKRIAEDKPTLNIHPGGNGCTAQKESNPKWLKDIEKIGTRAYAARLLVRFGGDMISPSEIETFRKIGYG